MKAYERRMERNRERILQAALELFQVHGIKKTTTNDIARKAGISPATVFLEKMGQILLYKSDMLGRYQGELMQTIISEDPEIRQLVDSGYLVEMRQNIIDFYEEGKRQGYVNPELSTDTIMRYMLIVRSGMAAESILSEDPEHNRKMMQELAPLFLYGIMGKPRLDDQK